MSILPAGVADGVAAILGETWTIVEELTPPWAAATRSVLVRGETSESRFVAQWSVGARPADRAAMDRRLRLGREIARLAPRLPLPEVLGGDSQGSSPYVVTRFVAGISGRELLGSDESAALLGTAAGRAARDVGSVPTAGLDLPGEWGDPGGLAAATSGWLIEAGPDLGAVAQDRIRGVIERLPEVFVSVEPVLAHGDLAPVNVLIRDGAVVAFLDLERARIAHPLFDAAWFRWIVRYHHPTHWRAAGDAFLAAAGIEQNASTLARLDILAALQCLEMLAETPRDQPATRRDWADRIGHVLEWGRGR